MANACAGGVWSWVACSRVRDTFGCFTFMEDMAGRIHRERDVDLVG